MAEDPEQAKRSQHHKAFREPEAVARLRQDNFKMLRVGLEREGIAPENLDAHFRNWVTKPTRSGCPAGTKCVGV
jgi:hypothetical protein